MMATPPRKSIWFFALVSDSVTDFFPRFVQAKSAQCTQTHLNISTSLTLQNKLILLPTQQNPYLQLTHTLSALFLVTCQPPN